MKEFKPEMAAPAAKIFMSIIKSGEWPEQWLTEYGTVLQKVNQPQCEDDLRVISLTNYFSKIFERFVMLWLMNFIGDKLDNRQFGATKGKFITHYFIEIVNFILYNQDLKIPHAVLLTLVDFSKAFNRSNHNILITLLSDMGVPGWFLKIVASFLKKRKLIIRQKGKTSKTMEMPGGTPQGSSLGCFLFIVLMTWAGKKITPIAIGKEINVPQHKRKPMDKIQCKFVDDFSLGVSINLAQKLNNKATTNFIGPPKYH